VADQAGVDDDLVRDVTEILTSLWARLYGRRAALDPAPLQERALRSRAGRQIRDCTRGNSLVSARLPRERP
jgi:hypothetical protein